MKRPRDVPSVIVVKNPDGLLEARMLELDLAVSSETHKGLLQEFRHAILMEYDLALRHQRPPFVHLLHVPAKFERVWKESSASNGGHLDLPPHVAAALAAAVRFPRFTLHVKEYKKAA